MGADRVIAEIAGRQHGVAGRAQLIAAGLGREAIRHRVAIGRLHEIHRGVYAVGHPAISPLGRDLAAVLASGPGSLVSHRSAAVLWDLLPRREGPVDVLRMPTRRRVRTGITIHHTTELPEIDLRRIRGIPVTAPDRTLLDLAAVGSADLQDAVDAARLRRLVRPDALLARAAGRPGARALREALTGDAGFTRSEAERRLLRILRRADLPMPETNVRVGPYEVDALWRRQRLIVEVDGYAYHSDREAFERDRLRDARLQAAGYRVLRFTWKQLTDRPEAVAARIAALL